MTKHAHPEPKPPCAHEALKFCAKCDAVECTACGAEWKNQPVTTVPMPCFREHVDEQGVRPSIPWAPSRPIRLGPPAPLWPGQTWCGQNGDVVDPKTVATISAHLHSDDRGRA